MLNHKDNKVSDPHKGQMTLDLGGIEPPANEPRSAMAKRLFRNHGGSGNAFGGESQFSGANYFESLPECVEAEVYGDENHEVHNGSLEWV